MGVTEPLTEILIVPITRSYVYDYLEEITHDINDSLRQAGIDASIYIWPQVLKPPTECFDWKRAQYSSQCVMSYINKHIRITGYNGYILCIGYIDSYKNGHSFIFGDASLSLNTACVYTKRLYPGFYNKKPGYDTYYKRVVKESIHELGHLLGLTHCDNRKCVMSPSNSIEDLDEKTMYFCNKCIGRIKNII